MNNNSYHPQSGQTLIETLVAALVLVMGITAAVSLAIYGLAATNDVTKQLVAVGLAREGMEAVKNMRDTNWLITPISNDCFDFYTTTGSSNVASCYKEWMTDLGSTTQSGTYGVGFVSEAGALDKPAYWELKATTGYGLDYKPSDVTINKGYYFPAYAAKGTSDFSRKITLTPENFAPFNHSDLGPRLKVKVEVWWVSERCPSSATPPPVNSCKIVVETYLTNWKNY